MSIVTFKCCPKPKTKLKKENIVQSGFSSPSLLSASKDWSKAYSRHKRIALPSLLHDPSDTMSRDNISESTAGSVAASRVKVPSAFEGGEIIVVDRDPALDVLAKQRFVTRLQVTKNIKEDREGTQHFFSIPEKPRRYVPLKPGHSLMDWFRLVNSEADMAGVGGVLMNVTEEELAKHNSISDAWTCLKGKVYNITRYLEYHPGGVDILMASAGKDSTNIFMKTHKWVNYETMLQKCLVGRFISIRAPVSLLDDRSKGRKERREILPPVALDIPVPVYLESASVPKFDWFQTEASLVIVIYTSFHKLSQENIIMDLLDNIIILLTVHLVEYVYCFHMELTHRFVEVRNMKIAPNGKVEITFTKEAPKIWQQLGVPLKSHNTYVPLNEKEPFSRECKLVSKNPVNHNSFLFTFEYPKGTKMLVPAAKHIILTIEEDGKKIRRAYTPLPQELMMNDKKDDSRLTVLIKIYERGLFTSKLNGLSIDSSVYISDYYGSFLLQKLENIYHFIGICGGTGVTPIISIVNHIVVRNEIKYETVRVLNFSRKEKDILWRDQFEKLASQNDRFSIHYVLSEPTVEWKGYIGLINKHLLQEFVRVVEKKKLIAICGPTEFNSICARYLEDLGLPDSEIFVFSNEQPCSDI